MSDVCKPCPHFPGYYFGFQYSDVTCPFCQLESRVAQLEARIIDAETAILGGLRKDSEYWLRYMPLTTSQPGDIESGGQ